MAAPRGRHRPYLESLPDESMKPQGELAERAESLLNELSGAQRQARQFEVELDHSRSALAAVLESERWRAGRWVVEPLARMRRVLASGDSRTD